MLYILLTLLILCFIFLFINKESQKEHFQWDPMWMGKTSLDCYSENAKDCLDYSNCGLCYKGGNKKCLPGDVNGPFFAEGCKYWEYRNVYDRHIFGDKITSIMPPWDKFNPGYEVMYPAPIGAFALH